MNDYITKPFKEEELLKLIERCLHGENSDMIETESVTEPGATHEALYD